MLKGRAMTIETTYTLARGNVAKLFDEVVHNRDTIIIHRRAAEDVALIAANELAGLMEIAQLTPFAEERQTPFDCPGPHQRRKARSKVGLGTGLELGLEETAPHRQTARSIPST